MTFLPASSDAQCFGVVIIDDADFEDAQAFIIQFGDLSTILQSVFPSSLIINIEDNNGMLM